MEYDIVTARADFASEASQNLKKKVNEMIQKGWKVSGGVTLAYDPNIQFNNCVMAQAMVREKIDNEKL